MAREVKRILTWHKNTNNLVKKGYQRIIILKKLFDFNVPVKDLLNIYVLYIRSILELSCAVWHSSITEDESADLERVQKVCLKIILRNKYESYENALYITELGTLSDRRTQLCLNFAKKCVKNENMSYMFPLNSNGSNMETRYHEKFFVQNCRTERLAKSAIPYFQNLLNLYYK